MNEHLSSFPVIITIPVAWGEMDAFQHVNNIVYFRYFESVRIAYFERMDLMTLMQETGIGPILGSTQCKYKVPLTYPDTVSVGARITSIEQDRFIMEYRVVSHSKNTVAAEGLATIVAFDYKNGGKSDLSREVISRINAIEESV